MAENKKQTKKEKPNYTYAFNKIFTGSYLIYNLGNELINFIKTDDNGSKYGNRRLVYLNPYGERGKDAAKETKYVLHVMETTYGNNNYYELIAISKVAQVFDKKTNTYINEPTYYNAKKDIGTVNERSEYENEKVNFLGKFIGDIFNDSKAHLCSFFAEELLEPKENTHIFFKGKNSENDVSKKLEDTHTKNDINDIFIINIGCNLSGSRNLCYSIKDDLTILDEIVKSKYVKKIDDNIKLPDDDEQCLAVICDRTNLEDSMSNQIAYFLSRDKNILKKFIDFLNSKENRDTKNITWTDETNFKIIREHNNIDILLESDTDIIVIENKIDSCIVEYDKNNKNKRPKAEDHILHSNENREEIFKSSNKIFSQLSKYYKYIIEDYEIANEYKDKTIDDIKKTLLAETKSTKKEDLINELKEIPDFIEKHNKKKKHFFILKPEYNSINEVELKKYYNGDKYRLITYTELYNILNDKEIDYNPYGQKISNPKSTFLYDQFKQSLEYVKSSKAEQMRKTAYIRLKQRICELNCENEINK